MNDGASRHNTFDEADHAFWVHRAEEFRSAGRRIPLVYYDTKGGQPEEGTLALWATIV
jgi:hypothetical protein